MFIQNDLHQQQESVGCSSGNEFIFGVGGLRFKSRADQIGHSLDNSSPSLQYFFESSCMPTSAKRSHQLEPDIGVIKRFYLNKIDNDLSN